MPRKIMHLKIRAISFLTALLMISVIIVGCDAYADGPERGENPTGIEASFSKICDGMGVDRDTAEEIYRLICDSGFTEEIRYVTSWSTVDNVKYYRVRAANGDKREVYLSDGIVSKITDGAIVYYDVTARDSTETTAETEHIIETEADGTAPDVSDTVIGTAEQIEIVLNTNSKKYHYPGCRSIEQISDRNRKTVYVSDIGELFDMGYTPCGICAKGDSRH